MKIFFCTLLTILILSCKSSSTAQNSNKSSQEISWIKAQIQEFKEHPFPRKSAISQFVYKEETVFLVESCYQCPDAMSFLYNEKKEKLCTFGGMIPNTNNCPDFFDVATDKEVLWKNF